MKKRLILLSGMALLMAALLYTGSSFSWFVDDTSSDAATITAAEIKTELKFELNSNRGIPNETVAIADVNKLVKEGASKDYIFRLIYTVTNEGDNDFGKSEHITNLKLAKAADKGLIAAVSYDKSGDRKIVYYGKHTGDSEFDLGPLLADFNILKRPTMGKEFIVEAEVLACQVTKEAAKDVFGIDVDSAEFSSLFK